MWRSTHRTAAGSTGWAFSRRARLGIELTGLAFRGQRCVHFGLHETRRLPTPNPDQPDSLLCGSLTCSRSSSSNVIHAGTFAEKLQTDRSASPKSAACTRCGRYSASNANASSRSGDAHGGNPLGRPASETPATDPSCPVKTSHSFCRFRE